MQTRKKSSKKQISLFQERVYEAVKKIPRGRVATYGAIASAVGVLRAARAVGNALNKNRFSAVSCHRVICANGAVGGYAWGSDKKIVRLQSEGVLIVNGVVNRAFIIE